MSKRIFVLLRTLQVGLDHSDRNWLPFMGTFHKVCHRFLRFEASAAGLPSDFTIYDRADCLQVVRKLRKYFRLDSRPAAGRTATGLNRRSGNYPSGCNEKALRRG